MALEPISLGQGRTHCPGLVADERGVVMGRRLALCFPNVARVIGFFRSFSREASIDELLSSLEIVETKAERGATELMVRFEVATSYAADKAAAVARQHRARVFTGTEHHHVPYRDKRSPLGFDVDADSLVVEPAALVLYTDAGPDVRAIGRTYALKTLLLNLTPQRLSSTERGLEQATTLVLRVEQGLSAAVCRYLWSRQLEATVETTTSAATTRFGGRAREIELIRCQQLPHHAAALLAQTPGITVFVPAAERLLVEWGYRHPISLDSCARVFDGDHTMLFHGRRKQTETLVTPQGGKEGGINIRDLVAVEVRGPQGVLAAPVATTTTGIDGLGVDLQLARLPRAGGSTMALLIDLDRLPWFTKLIYLLPAAILRSYDAAITDRYIIVVNRRGVQGIPFGTPMTELHPQLFVPVGFGLLPRVDYELLREHLQLHAERLTFFPDGQPAFSIDKAKMQPLSRAVVAPERAQESILALDARDPLRELATPTVQHKKPGAFSLWRGTKNLAPKTPAALGGNNT
jgi:FtsH ternary system domain X7